MSADEPRRRRKVDDLPFPDTCDPDPLDNWDGFGPAPGQDAVWDAFDLDDELDEPLPEHGDFWMEPNEEEV